MHNLTTLRKALKESPENVRLWLLLGQTCVSSKSLREARKAYDKALALAPMEPEAHLGVARVLFQQEKLSEAAVRTQSILQEHPSFAPGHVLMAKIYLAESDPESASEHYDMAKALSKSAADREIEQQLAHHAPKTVSEPRDGKSNGGRPKLVANAGWDGPDLEFDIPDCFDDELANMEGASIEQEEFEFAEEFNIEEFERPKGSFEDVAGLEDVKDELLMKLVKAYEYQDLFRAYGKKAGGGILLYGPPGCGKSLICRALAGETDAAFYTLKLHQILEMYIGCSEKNLHSFFQMAREKAPAVIFIDELDGIGADRSDTKQSAARTVVHQFLTELDGHDGANEGLLVIGATSAIWNVDPAFLRPGRFDRRIYVAPPEAEAREKILRLQAKNRPVGDLDFKSLAAKLHDFSGADIAQLFDLAIEDALRIAMKKRSVVPLTMKMLEDAAKRVEPSVCLWKEYEKRRQAGQ